MIILKANKNNFIYLIELSRHIGKPIIFPTDTIYGIGADINNINANKFIYEVKFRKLKKPFPILIGSKSQLNMLVEHITPCQHTIINKFWPGPYTFILNAKKKLNNIYKENDKVAVRFPHVKWLSEGLSEINCPVTATSANISGKSYTNDIEKIINTFKKDISLYLYDGINNSHSSTIIDISDENNIRFIRNPFNISLEDITFK